MWIYQTGLIVHGIYPLRHENFKGVGITVRCCDGRINVGDTFDILREYKQRLCMADFEDLPTIKAELEISLTVRHIEAYQKKLEWINGGITGYVELEGEVPVLMEGFILGFKNKPDWCQYKNDGVD